MLPRSGLRLTADNGAIDQVLDCLPEHLLLAVLSLRLLKHTLRYLPAAFHASALRARHPSIDTRRSLCLPLIPLDLMLPALTATATLGNQHNLSLAGATFPLACGPCIGILRQLTSVAALCMRDIGMTEDVAEPLGGALRAMPLLLRLDLSNNRVTGRIMHTLACHLSGCTALRSIDILDWQVVRNGMVAEDVAAVLRAVTPLHNLTSLSIGIDHYVVAPLRHKVTHPMSQHLPTLQQAIRGMPALQILTLPCQRLDATAAVAFSDVLAAAPRLCRVALCAPEGGRMQHQPFHVPELPCDYDTIGRWLGDRKMLTCLQLRLEYVSGRCALTCMEHLAQLPQLCQLQLLLLAGTCDRVVPAGDAIAAALAQVLPGMTRLTELRMFDDKPRVGTAEQLSIAPAQRLVEAVAAATQLRILRLPLCTDTMQEIAPPLCRASHLTSLEVMLCVRHVAWGPRATHEALRAAVPLLPRVAMLCVSCGIAAAPMHLKPLNDAGPALGNLRVLDVRCASCLHDAAELQGLLKSVSCMTSLQRLHCSARVGSAVGVGGGAALRGPGALELRELCDGLIGAGALTSLHWSVADGAGKPLGIRQLLRACASLSALHELTLNQLPEAACADFVVIVPQLPHRLLEVRVETREAAHAVARAVAQLVHLREACFRTWEGGDCVEVAREAARQLPACVLCH